MTVLESMFTDLTSSDLWEIRQKDFVKEGHSLLDVPHTTSIKIKLSGIFTTQFTQKFIYMAEAQNADAGLTVSDRIEMTSQIEHEGILYEITKEIITDYLHGPRIYTYLLRRVESTP